MVGRRIVNDFRGFSVAQQFVFLFATVSTWGGGNCERPGQSFPALLPGVRLPKCHLLFLFNWKIPEVESGKCCEYSIVVYNKTSTILAHRHHTEMVGHFESLHPCPHKKDGSWHVPLDPRTIPRSSTRPTPAWRPEVLCVPTVVSFPPNHISSCLEIGMESLDSHPNTELLTEEIQP